MPVIDEEDINVVGVDDSGREYLSNGLIVKREDSTMRIVGRWDPASTAGGGTLFEESLARLSGRTMENLE